MDERTQTFGEKAVGLSFNPSGMGDVDKLKKLYAEIIDHMDDFRKGYIKRSDNPKIIRLYSVAITEAQTAQMWAVKAVTWRCLAFFAVLALCSPALADQPVKYPPGTSPAAIAVNEAIRAEIAGKPGVEFCLLIDTRTPEGKCLRKIVLEAGGGAPGF